MDLRFQTRGAGKASLRKWHLHRHMREVRADGEGAEVDQDLR